MKKFTSLGTEEPQAGNFETRGARFDRKAQQAISWPLRAVLAQPTVPPLL